MQYLTKYPFSWAVILVIFVICLIPVPEVAVSGVPGFDKFVHSGMYGFLCLVIWGERLRQKRRRPLNWNHCFIGAFLLPLLMSGLIELLQAYATTCRSGDWWDMGANTLGIVLVWLFVQILRKKQVI